MYHFIYCILYHYQDPAPTNAEPSTENTESQPSNVIAPVDTTSSSHDQIYTNVHSNQSNFTENDYFDVELESRIPNHNTDSNEHSRLIYTIKSLSEKTSHQNQAPISNGSSSSTISSPSDGSLAENGVNDNVSISSSDVTFFDPELASDTDLNKSSSISVDFYDCDDDRSTHVVPSASSNSVNIDTTQLANGHHNDIFTPAILTDSDSGSESLPISQSTSLSSTFTVNSSNSGSNQTLQESALLELCLLSKQQYDAEDYDPDTQDRNSDEDTTQSTETDELLMEDTPLIINHNGDASDGVVVEETYDIEEEVDCTDARSADDYSQPDEDEFKPQRVRRCSSLKSGKTPPGTPGRKKFVRFADVLGLDLADVKTFMDDIPTVPREAYQDLVVSYDQIDGIDGSSTDIVPTFVSGAYVEKVLVPMFQQPGGNVEFLDRVRDQNVCLENAVVTDPICLTISGTVRVRNLDFNKSVHIRYSLDSWVSYADFQASYIDKSCDGFSDKFCFTIFGNSLNIGQRIEMAVRFSCKGEQFWDSNYGVNYCFQCMPSSFTQGQLYTTATDESALSPRNSIDEISAGFLPEFPMSDFRPPNSTTMQTDTTGSFY